MIDSHGSQRSSDGVTAIVDALYRDFLLRDLFAKIVPGALVLVSVLDGLGVSVGWVGNARSASLVGALIFLGAAWLIGFAVQSVGELTKVIRHHPARYAEASERYARRILFQQAATEDEQRQVERYTIIKEAAGNGATSLLLASLFWAWGGVPSGGLPQVLRLLLSVLTILVLAGALDHANRSHARKQDDYIESVLDRGSLEGGR